MTTKTLYPWMVALLLATGAQAQELPAKALRSMAAACANCHGTGGAAREGVPALAGRDRERMLSRLLEYKTDRREATVMHQLAKAYSDDELRQLAAYFAAQPRAGAGS